MFVQLLVSKSLNTWCQSDHLTIYNSHHSIANALSFHSPANAQPTSKGEKQRRLIAVITKFSGEHNAQALQNNPLSFCKVTSNMLFNHLLPFYTETWRH